MYKDLLNKKVLVRSADAGLYFGTLTNVDGETCRLENARNIWHWTGALCFADIANSGISGDKVSCIISAIILTGVCIIAPLSEAAIENLESQPVWSM